MSDLDSSMQMNLEPEQESVLKGESGPAMAKAMKTLVEYGKAFGASGLVPVKSGHLAGSFGIITYKAYYNILDRLVRDGVGVKVPTTVNPRPGADLNLVNRVVFSKQKKLERLFEALGVTPNYSCACYEGPNRPEKGDVVAWAESSAVQFANSALGARTNRHSLLIDICSAVTGLTPEFGYLLDENRKGQVLVKVEDKSIDPSGLGFLVGKAVVDKAPVIEHIDVDWPGLKNMGGAMAAAGGVALFHVEGLTPEAPDLKSVFDGEPPETMTVTRADYDELRKRGAEKTDLVVFGCPQMTYEEAIRLAERFSGKLSKKPVWFCMIPEHKERFLKTDLYAKAFEAGVKVYDHCPLAALTVRVGNKNILSSSGKLYYYLEGAEYGSDEDCLRACGV